jgi:hypothetical protein
MNFAKKLSIAFPLEEEKKQFDDWFDEQEFKTANEVIEKVDDFIEEKGIDAIFDEDAYVKSVYRFLEKGNTNFIPYFIKN